MTYIGQQPSTTFDSGIQDRFTGLTTNTVTLTHDISAETDILVVWNNIVQDSSTYSVGGTGNKTLTLGGTLVSADIVTVYYTNKVMQSVSPTAGSVQTLSINDGAVTGAKLNTDVISAQTALGATPADTDELLVSDAGVLKRVDYSYLKGGDNTPAFSAYKDSADQSLSGGGDVKIQYETEIFDSDSCYDKDTNYRFTPNVAGKYFFQASAYVDTNAGAGTLTIMGCKIKKNGSTVAKQRTNLDNNNGRTMTQQISCVLDMNGSSDYVEAFAHAETSSGAGQVRREIREGSNFMGFKLIT